jgi:hypothetical protein
VKLTIYSF